MTGVSGNPLKINAINAMKASTTVAIAMPRDVLWDGPRLLSNFNINVIIQSLAPRACYWRGIQVARFRNIGPHLVVLVVLLEPRMLDLELANVPQTICGIDIIEIMLFKFEPFLCRAGGEFRSDLIFRRVSQSMRSIFTHVQNDVA
jgi:hypothetical protein